MSQTVNNQSQQPLQLRKRGVFYNLLWGWPWMLVGMFLASLLVSLVIEYVDMTFFWPELGASHSEAVMHTEKRIVKPAIYIPCMLYLSWPTAVYPNLLLLPAAILLGIAVTVTTASFKKYL